MPTPTPGAIAAYEAHGGKALDAEVSTFKEPVELLVDYSVANAIARSRKAHDLFFRQELA